MGGGALADLRQEYRRGGLRRSELAADPVEQFRLWFSQAQAAAVPEPNAMVLCSSDGQRLSSRTVLLKAFDQRGFVFFTNYESRKARQIAQQPAVSLLFPWYVLERQVAIEGQAERISAAESLAYFRSRPWGSRLGAWVSQQSQVISSRQILEMQWEHMRQRFAAGEIPRPPSWGGFRVVPATIEFWQGRENRLHDRFLYSRASARSAAEGSTPQSAPPWRLERLAP
ncbi:pyridoxamine 5'-phosphate oxidase [Cyanobium sp. LEGE 06143]|jgi:pyridoxamine 5'-phosphate oxidase|uniref:pyridoxamine 5'-phosphate oxidase n=1 Tax=Cyanobium sp. LEGE 06143 TaxID=945727 RepID=UPI0018826305|nr:pyridoxamine 5'-phosphate oxidase [Cyanobium sp. LEGE 06143]MBE9172639.1 pyridoxamine 5'-phosphate oxidase [Cyanobium sp. LEGE 06143]